MRREDFKEELFRKNSKRRSDDDEIFSLRLESKRAREKDEERKPVNFDRRWREDGS